MRVHQILKAKTNHSVVTMPPGTTVAAAAQTLSDKRIGALVVSADGTTVNGILSERDIVRELGRRGPSCMEDLVDNIMTRDPVCAARSDNSDDIFRVMTERRFRHLPVVEEGKMIGLISIGDVVVARLSELEMEKQALEGMIMGN
ncbi:MAG: CBS domain-containing protein [Rhodobacteraceae bacterium]|nr:CBS domain-containing protein [Paracoccaceae bacterium]